MTSPNLLTALLTIRDAALPEAGLMAGVDTWSALVEELQKVAGDAVAGCDSAEGAGEAELTQFFLRQLDGPMPESTERLAKELAKAFKTKFPFEIPPKPAPDAWRSALQFYASEWDFSGEGVCQPTAELFVDKGRIARDALRIAAAPVPPADGARILRLEQAIRDSIESLERNSTSAPVVECLKAALSPSGTGAAEPVAWPDHPGATVDAVAFAEGVKRYPNMDRDASDLTLADKQAACQRAFINGFKRAMEMRAHLVRRDRESLTDLRNSFVEICRSTDMRSGSNDPYANRIANEAIKSIDAILSLPVPPGAGDREAARILRGWAKAYRDTPEHRFPSDPNAEFFPVDLENAADLLDPRQAPHSGSGDGR